MSQEFVITAVGADRPGLVDDFTRFLFDAGANLADSRMVNLRGQFAFIALVEAEGTAADAVRNSAAAHGKSVGLQVTVTPQPQTAGAGQGGLKMKLKAYALDQPGIAHRIAHLLHERGINIEELETQLNPGPYNSRPQFSVELLMTVPADVQVGTLRDDLTQLCNSLNCDFDLDKG